ncbi:ion channel [Parvularcula oceani]|uniref:ion channel n=1 Tax=Parvularcula oceani TaxID=1247963 RepID=UPI00138DE672|nr:transporter substrate-binding domain-containing protein [Parvularcula oceani]
MSACLLLFWIGLSAASAQTGDPRRSQPAGEEGPAFEARLDAPSAPLRVGIAERPPFSLRGEDGTWQGLAVNLWRTAAEDLGFDYEFVELSEDGLIDAVADGRADVALPVYATSEAAERADLVFPFYTATLGVAEQPSNSFVDTVMNLFSWQFLRIILYLSVLLLIVGAIVWLLERRRNDDQFDRSWLKGLGDGFWWAGVTLTTIGYGDKAPRTTSGRAVAMLWMLIGLSVSAALTAAVVSATDIRSRSTDDLAAYVGKKTVGAVPGTGAFDYLDLSGKAPRRFDTLGAGLEAVADGEIDMFVHAAPALRFTAQGRGMNLDVSTTRAEPFFVTMAVRDDDALAETLERAVVTRATTSAWWSHVDRWIPEGRQR